MKKALIELELLEKGDLILLPDGEAIVMEDEKINSPDDRFRGEIKIKWIDNCRSYKNNKMEMVLRENCSLK
jgi:hypothetical protein